MKVICPFFSCIFLFRFLPDIFPECTYPNYQAYSECHPVHDLSTEQSLLPLPILRLLSLQLVHPIVSHLANVQVVPL